MLNLCDNEGNTPVIVAADNGKDQSLLILANAGADVNILNANTYTAVMIAASKGFSKCVQVLLEAGASVNTCNSPGDTALSMAACGSHLGSVELLLSAGADVNWANKFGDTALMSACAQDLMNIHVVLKLLKAGAHINKKHIFGHNALQKHIAHNTVPNAELCKLLYVAGETFDRRTVYKYDQAGHISGTATVPQYLLNFAPNYTLMNLCRTAVRKALIEDQPHINLLHSVPALGVPEIIVQYLLYDVNLDEPVAQA